MRTLVQEIAVYTFKEASPELKEKIRDDIKYNWNLYEHNMDERLTTLKTIATLLDANLDYSLSCVADRGEYIKFTPKYDELNFSNLWETIDQCKECPLTGMCYDHDFIDHLSKYNLTQDGLNFASNLFIESVHDEYTSMLQDDYINDMCEVNDYEFTNDGKLY